MKGKVAFVSGAGSGIGKTTATRLAELGATVLLSDINDDNGKKVTQEIIDDGGAAHYYHLDVANRDDVHSLFKTIAKEHGKLDLAVNNAGIGGSLAPMHEVDIKHWNQMMDINLSGVFHCMQAELQLMLSNQTKGGIVNVSSLAGLNGIPNGSPYCAAKHAVIGLSKSAAREYAKAGIRVNSVCPGFTETAILNGLPQKFLDFNLNYLVPMKRLGKTEEIANAIIWLLSDQSSFVTGHSLHLDGGLMA